MVIVRLMGGLGNQMFQYAAARRVSHVRNVPLKLDLSHFGHIPAGDTPWQYVLSVFAIREEFATPEDIRSLTWGRANRFTKMLLGIIERRLPPDRRYGLGFFSIREEIASPGDIRDLKWGGTNRILRMLRSRIEQGLPPGRRTWIRERHFQFDPEILDIAGHVYLDGFWQSEKYFSDIQDILRREFTVRGVPDPLTSEMCRQASSGESVSVHIRRGDYVSNPVTSRFHGTCPPDYYERAVSHIARRASPLHFFIFSDDPAWARKNLTLDHPATYVEHNGPDKGHEDLRIMTHCKHHIIANSSFSWWGAWLSNTPGKIVVAPRKWFADEKIRTEDLVPDPWVRL